MFPWRPAPLAGVLLSGNEPESRRLALTWTIAARRCQPGSVVGRDPRRHRRERPHLDRLGRRRLRAALVGLRRDPLLEPLLQRPLPHREPRLAPPPLPPALPGVRRGRPGAPPRGPR